MPIQPNKPTGPMSVKSVSRGGPGPYARGPPRGPPIQNRANQGGAAVKNQGVSNHGRGPLMKGRSTCSVVSRAQAPNMPTIDEDAVQMMDDFTQLGISRPARQSGPVHDPSMAPSPSMVTVNSIGFSTVRSHTSLGSTARAVRSDLCTLTTRTRQSFVKGEIITVAHHVTNLDPNLSLNDQCLKLTEVGGVVSKRRMFIILMINQENMLCIPLFTNGHTGMRKKHPSVRHEYMSMANVGDKGFVNQCIHPPIEANMRHPLDKDSTIHLGDVVKVDCRERIAKVGCVTEDSYRRLAEMWMDFMDRSIDGEW